VGEFRFSHATVAKEAKVDTRSGLREVIYHATVAKEAKVDARNEIRGGLSGLCVIFSLGTKKRPEGDCPSGLKTNRRFAKAF